MGFKIKISDGKTSKRYKDANGYLHIENNQIAKAGVFDYLKKEVDSTITQDDAEEIVRVCRTFDDLKTNKDLFSKMPIVLGHKWVGEEQDKVAGAIGEVITAQEPYLFADLIIYSQELINAIENDRIVELSPAYEADILVEGGEYLGEPYQYEQKLKRVNHLAVVENGRSGSDLRLQDEKNKGVSMKTKMQKIADSLAGMLKKLKDEEGVEPKKTEDEDKREIIRELMAVSAKPIEEFDGGEDEKIKTIAELAEKLAYKPSETSQVDDSEGEGEGKGEEGKKVDDNEPSDEDEKKGVEKIADSLIGIIDARLQQFEKKVQKINDENSVAYAEVSKVVGDFNTNGMDSQAMYAYGYKCLSGRVLDSGIDAKSAFKIKAIEVKPAFEAKQVQDNKPQEMSELHKNLLANIK